MNQPMAAGIPCERGLVPLPRGAWEVPLELVAGCSHWGM